MRLHKFEHAALMLEQDGHKLFIDPGAMTTPLSETTATAAVVITHEHADHWTPEQIALVLRSSPEAKILSTDAVVAAVLTAFPSAQAIAVRAGDEHTVGPFTLRFFGDEHAVIHHSIPTIKNVGVMVNDTLYYGGDSLVPPANFSGHIDLLAVPAGAPWLTIGAVIDYVLQLRPRRTFASHEMGLSRWGKDLAAERIRSATLAGGGEYIVLTPGSCYDV